MELEISVSEAVKYEEINVQERSVNVGLQKLKEAASFRLYRLSKRDDLIDYPHRLSQGLTSEYIEEYRLYRLYVL